MRKLKVRYLDQLGEIRRIVQLTEKLLIVHTAAGVFYAKDFGGGYEAFTPERTFRNLKQEGGKLV